MMITDDWSNDEVEEDEDKYRECKDWLRPWRLRGVMRGIIDAVAPPHCIKNNSVHSKIFVLGVEGIPYCSFVHVVIVAVVLQMVSVCSTTLAWTVISPVMQCLNSSKNKLLGDWLLANKHTNKPFWSDGRRTVQTRSWVVSQESPRH